MYLFTTQKGKNCVRKTSEGVNFSHRRSHEFNIKIEFCLNEHLKLTIRKNR